MRLQLNLQTIKAEKQIASKLLLKITINGVIQFKSDWGIRQKDNIYPFFQKNYIDLPENQLNYIKFQIRNENKQLLVQKTVLSEQAVPDYIRQRNRNQLQFSIQKDKIRLKYILTQIINDEQDELSFRKRKSIIEERQDLMKNQAGRLEILKLGSDAYNFGLRIDPIVWFCYQAQQVLSWKSPALTLGAGVALTFVIMNLKMAILIAAVCLVFGKNPLLKRIQKISKKKDFHKRLLIPRDNYAFLQTCMKTYNEVFQKVHQFCLNEDKTGVINVIHYISRISFILVILLFIFDVQKLLVFALWSLLLLLSPSGIKFFKQIWPSFIYLQKLMSKVTQNFAIFFERVVGNTQTQKQVIKQFYYYQYQRWFMLNGWTKPLGIMQYHYANQDGKIQIQLKDTPPEGWTWIKDYQIQYSQNTDENGYQYRNDLPATPFSKVPSLAFLRRRRFIRRCILQIYKKKKDQVVNKNSPQKLLDKIQ